MQRLIVLQARLAPGGSVVNGAVCRPSVRASLLTALRGSADFGRIQPRAVKLSHPLRGSSPKGRTQGVKKVAAATFLNEGFAFIAVSISASSEHSSLLAYAYATLRNLCPCRATPHWGDGSFGNCKHLHSLVGASASLKADGRKKCKEWFRLIGQCRSKLGTDYTCSLQAMSCVSWASPASMPKPPRPRGKAPRYDSSQRGCGPSDTSQ